MAKSEVRLGDRRCIPCEGGVTPLLPHEAEALLAELHTEHDSEDGDDWMLVDEAHLLVKQFMFANFKKTMEFVNKVAAIAEEEGHHPDMVVSYGSVSIELSTHAIGGLSENDFVLAAKIDKIGK